ncbi:MAG: metallophosphoesterase [Rubellimicrobium sp.]|nr:metallophosphoesterase [Rubellimicrobium sp.]
MNRGQKQRAAIEQEQRAKDTTDLATTDIIPDIHGQAGKLDLALANLGWRRTALGWTHPEPSRSILFLGDFIDRGPDNRAVLRVVRDLIEAGRARAIMGNHELNALHFHTIDPETGQPLRAHVARNIDQHASFLKEFPVGAPETADALDWMRNLPLFLEARHFRAVHAAWIVDVVKGLRDLAHDGVLDHEQIIRAGRKGDPLHDLAETLTKGPELQLPKGFGFTDKGGHHRQEVRVRWWQGGAETWRDIAISVPDSNALPDGLLPDAVAASIYPPGERPVFFGHYWLSGTPVLQRQNALCLDYSAGLDGPLVTYALGESAGPLSLGNLTVHAT